MEDNERLGLVRKPVQVDGQAGYLVMTGGNSGPDPCVLVVGDPCSEFVRTAVRLVREYDIDAVQCDDVYSAVAVTVNAAGRLALIVGSMRDLARENGRFFQIAGASAARCCCLLEKSVAADRNDLLPALRAGASILGSAQEIRGVLEEWLAEGRRRAPNGALGDLLAEDLRTTEAELSALLGQRTDE